MGILDDILAPVVALDPTGLAATAVGAVTGTVGGLPVVGGVLGAGGAPGPLGAVGGVLAAPGQLLGGVFGGDPAPEIGPNLTGFSGGNGTTQTRTIIERRNVATGAVTRQIKNGSPFLMNSDITAMKRTIKAVGLVNKRMPRKSVKQSQSKMLAEAVQQRVLLQLAGPDKCS